MHIAIIGAAGMLGRKLSAALASSGRLGKNEITKMTLLDVVEPHAPKGWGGETILKAGDLSAAGQAQALISGRPDIVFHLAAIVSGEAELDFDKGYRINLDGTRYLFDAIRERSASDAPSGHAYQTSFITRH